VTGGGGGGGGGGDGRRYRSVRDMRCLNEAAVVLELGI